MSVLSSRESDSSLAVHSIDSVERLNEGEWNTIVDHTDQGSVFHRYKWIRAIESALPYEPRHLTVTKKGNLVAVFPNFIHPIEQTPFQRITSISPGFGGPLLNTDPGACLSLFIEELQELHNRRTLVHQIRTADTGYVRYNEYLRANGYDPELSECRITLNLKKGYDEIIAEMDAGRRQAIRRGKSNDSEIVEEDITTDNLDRYHRAYERVMDRVGGDTYPRRFFRALAELDSRLLLLTCRVDGEYAGGLLQILDDEQDTVHGFFTAVPQEYFEHNASELLYDRVIQWAIDNGYETYDFGGTPASFEDGLFKFKASFGGKVIPTLVWERSNGPQGRLFRSGRSLYRRYR